MFFFRALYYDRSQRCAIGFALARDQIDKPGSVGVRMEAGSGAARSAGETFCVYTVIVCMEALSVTVTTAARGGGHDGGTIATNTNTICAT